MDPHAQTFATRGPDYGLFVCQVGLGVGQCYDPYQVRHAYNVDTLIKSGLNGSGKTIVIVDAYQNPNIASQLDAWDTNYGLTPVNAGPGSPSFTIVAPNGLTPFDQHSNAMLSWAEEISLDVEWAHAMAPGANIVLELAKDSYDSSLIAAVNDAVTHHRGDVISMSFGEADKCLSPSEVAQWHQAFANATKAGITLMASSGDQGAAQRSCDGTSWIKSTSSPASDPLVTAVGGTELHAADYCLTVLGCVPANNPAAGTYFGEVAWNEGPPFGDYQSYFNATEASGGGYSTVWDEPSYQRGTFRASGRGVPDVAYNAAILHGVLAYLDIPGIPAGFYTFGGTSAGAPQWSALIAIADQAAGHNYGFINAALYHLSHSPSEYATVFHDITSGTNSAMEIAADGTPVIIQGFNAKPGWDAVTGLGSPKAVALVTQLPSYWSVGQGTAAIAVSSHAQGNTSHKGHVQPN